MQIMQSETYATRDWSEIVWLLFNNVPVVRAERVNDRCVVFHFRDPDRCRRLVLSLSYSREAETEIHTKTLDAVRRARLILRKTL